MAGEAASLRPGQAWPKLQKSITGFQRDKRSVSGNGRGWAVDDRRDLRVSDRIRVMGEARLHVVFGRGQAGNALTARLPRLGVAVRAEQFPLLQRAG
jgi:hypothetical protein